MHMEDLKMDEIVLVRVTPAGGWLEQDSMHSLERASMNCITMHKLPRYFERKKIFYRDSPRQSRRYDFACA